MRYVPHPHIARRRREGPVKVADQLPAGSGVARFNTWLAIRTTNTVGTMWCAYVFCVLAAIGIPAAIGPGGVGVVNWFTEEFIQLVLLSVIMVGQSIQGVASDKRSQQTYDDTEAILDGQRQIQEHLAELEAQLAAAVAQVSGGAGSNPARSEGLPAETAARSAAGRVVPPPAAAPGGERM